MNKKDSHDWSMDRREFIKFGLLAAACLVVPANALAAASDFFSGERTLSFYNTHTGEFLDAPYWMEGEYISESLQDINHILRDHRSGETRQIDRNLLDLLCRLKTTLGCNEPFHVISGYRSPKTNALLRKKSRRVAKNSLHIQGKAIDIRVPGCELNTLRRAAVDLKIGGVGYYPRKEFVHVDVGRVRYW